MTTAEPIIARITDPDVQRALRVVLRNKTGMQRQWAIDAQAERGLRALYGLDLDLTTRQAATWLGCHVNTVKNYHRDGKLPNAYYRSPRALRVPLRDLEAFKRNVRHIRRRRVGDARDVV